MSFADKFFKFKAGELESPPITTGGSVLLVDAMNMFLRCFSATPTMDEDGKHVGGITGFLLSVGKTIRDFKPSQVIIIWDGPGGSQRRRKLFPNYKGGRHMQKLNRTYRWEEDDEKNAEAEKEALKWQWVLLHEILQCLPVIVIKQPNVEADDVIAFLATTLEKRGSSSIIVSTDKDFLQLVNENISVWNPIKKKMYTPQRVVEDYGFHPNNFLLYRMITGDSSDKIPGVKGIKEKTLLKHFPELSEADPRDIEFLFESATRQIQGVKKPPVVLSTLLASREQVNLNLQLMRLDEVSASGHTLSEVLTLFERGPFDLNKMELTKLLRYNKLMHVFSNYETWIRETFFPLSRYKLSTKG
jgi:5'-3' exonuclease